MNPQPHHHVFFAIFKIFWFNPVFNSVAYLLYRVDPMLEDNIPDLLPELRPYQRRAAYWMVQREKGDSRSLVESGKSPFFSPLCLPVDFLDTCTKMFYNPFRYLFSIGPEN
jgi:E3 ubiquitin-protein ligase SHPRH